MNRSKYKMTISLTAKKMRDLFLLLLSIVALIAPMQHVSAQQQFPVKIQPSVSFPSTFLSDYADPANTNIRIFLSDVTKQDYLINVRVTLTNLSTKGISYSSVHGINVTVDGGVPYFLNSNELLNLFAFNDMQILGGTQEPNILPEGQYSMSLQAYDGNLLPAIEVPVSNALTDFTLFMVVRYDPPLLNSPVDKQEFDLQTTNQNIFFNWTPRHIAYTSLHIQYRYRLVRVLPVDRNPYDAVNASVTGATGNIDADALDFATFIYSPSDLQLIPGAVYAWQVQAYEMVNGKVSTARFKNQGLSEVFTLSIKENCGQITLVPPVITGNSVTFTWNGDAHSTYNEYEFNYRKVGSNLPWTPITTAQNTVTLDNTVLQTGVAYEYNVRARCNNWLAPVQGSNVTLSKPTCSTPAPLTVNTSNNSTLLSWTAVDGPDSLQLSYKITGSTDPFTTKILYPSDVQYALPLLTSGGYTIRLDAFCGTETVLGAENTIDYNENGVVGPCPIPMPFELVATRLKGSGSAVNTQSDAANIKWNLMTVHTGSKITYWHKDSSAVTYTYTQLDPALGVNGIHVYDDQMYMYQIDYLCSATKHVVTPVGMFRILSSSGQLNLDPPTANCFPPVDIRAEARDTVSARVEWDKVSGAEGYELSYRIKGAKTPFATFNTTATNAILKPLEANAQYQLLVRVKCGGVFSIYSDTALVDLSLGRTRNCDTVSFFTSLLKTTTNIQVAWSYDSTCTGYIIKFREDAQPISSEYTQAFTNIDSLKHNNVVRDTARYTFQNLKSGTKYIFRIQKICGQNNALFNIPIEVSTLADAKSDGTCGSGKVCDKNPAAPLKSLAVGDSIYCADYGIVVDSLTTATSNPSAGLYSGLGHMNMPVPGLGDFVSMHVSFKNVKINDKPNSCVYDGTINIDSMNASIIPITIRDSVKALMAKAQDAVDQANALLAQAQAGIDQLQAGLQQGIDYFQGGDGVGSVKTGQLGDQQIATNISVPPPTATVSGTQVTVNGVTATVSSLPALLKDTDGEVFQVTSTGQLTYVGKYDTTFAKDTTLDLSDQVVTYSEYTGTPGPIYDFDAYQDIFSNSIQLKSEYEKINDNYYVPAKFITPGMLDKVTATINTSNADARKVVFSNSTGFVYDASPNGKTFTLNLAGGPASDGQYIYAWYVDGATKKAIGKLLMPSYAPQTKNVVIIPVKDPLGRVYDASIFESYLNQTYNKIGITYHVTIDNSFNTNTDWTTDGITSIQPSGSSLLNDDYRGKEADVIEAYVAFKGEENIDDQTAYFIMVNEVSLMKDDSNVQLLGKMPPEEQFGFLYSGGFGGNGSANAVSATVTAAIANGLKRTLAHELGHGAYHLEHTFIALYLGKTSEKSTDNLMDYNNGNVVWKLQWDIIHAPGHVWGILKRERDALFSDNKVKLIFYHTYQQCPTKVYSCRSYENTFAQPYETAWKRTASIPTYWIKVDDVPVQGEFTDDGDVVTREFLIKINSPMTIKGFTPTVEHKYIDGEIFSKYFKTYYAVGLISEYEVAVQNWINRYYKPSNDPAFQSATAIENLARAITKGGALDPHIVCNIDPAYLYQVDYKVGNLTESVYYNSEEIAYWLWGYFAYRKFNFTYDNMAAFGMQYCQRPQYNSIYGDFLYDTPWNVKAMKEGLMYGTPSGPYSYEEKYMNYRMDIEYSMSSSYLVKGIGLSDLAEVTLFIYTGGSGTVLKKVSLHMAKNMVIAALTNYLVQTAVLMIGQGKTYDEAIAAVNYEDVLWSGLSTAITNQSEAMALDCINEMINKYQELEHTNTDIDIKLLITRACVLSLVKNYLFNKYLTGSTSPYAKTLSRSFENKTLSTVKNNIRVIFGCTPTEVDQILATIPKEILDELIK